MYIVYFLRYFEIVIDVNIKLLIVYVFGEFYFYDSSGFWRKFWFLVYGLYFFGDGIKLCK